MKNSLTLMGKIIWVFSMLFPIALSTKPQTIVKVIVDQPKKLEIVANELFSQSANAIILGSNVKIEGGVSPYSYTWLKDSQPIGSSLVSEVPLNTSTNGLTLKVKDANNCTCTKGAILTGTTDIKEDPFNIGIYPNPAKDFLIINPNKIEGTLHVSIFDPNGTFLLKKQIEGMSLIGINLPPGLYFIRIENTKKQIVATKKFIVL